MKRSIAQFIGVTDYEELHRQEVKRRQEKGLSPLSDELLTRGLKGAYARMYPEEVK